MLDRIVYFKVPEGCKMNKNYINKAKNLPPFGSFKIIERRGQIIAHCEGEKKGEPADWHYREVYFNLKGMLIKLGEIIYIKVWKYTSKNDVLTRPAPVPFLGVWIEGISNYKKRHKKGKLIYCVYTGDSYFEYLVGFRMGETIYEDVKEWLGKSLDNFNVQSLDNDMRIDTQN